MQLLNDRLIRRKLYPKPNTGNRSSDSLLRSPLSAPHHKLPLRWQALNLGKAPAYRRSCCSWHSQKHRAPRTPSRCSSSTLGLHMLPGSLLPDAGVDNVIAGCTGAAKLLVLAFYMPYTPCSTRAAQVLGTHIQEHTR